MTQQLCCHFPSCNTKKEVKNSCMIKIVDESASICLPFCEYHSYIIMGGNFTAKKTSVPIGPEPKQSSELIIDGYKFELVGPFLEVEMVEQVFGAIELMKKSKK